MNYANEFKLVSARVIFQFEDATIEELQLYRSSFHDGEYINNLKELFLPFIGGEHKYFNPDFGTDELRIRYWKCSF